MADRKRTPTANSRKLELRLPPELHDAVKDLAVYSHRSVNSQIVYVLEQWVRTQRALLRELSSNDSPLVSRPRTPGSSI